MTSTITRALLKRMREEEEEKMNKTQLKIYSKQNFHFHFLQQQKTAIVQKLNSLNLNLYRE